MKDTYTEMDTFVTSDGNTILFRPDQVLHFFLTHYEHNHSSLTEEEKSEEFLLNHLYSDIIFKAYKEPLQKFLQEGGGSFTPFGETHVAPEEDYQRMLANGPDEHETEEMFQLKLERIKKHKEWIENNT